MKVEASTMTNAEVRLRGLQAVRRIGAQGKPFQTMEVRVAVGIDLNDRPRSKVIHNLMRELRDEKILRSVVTDKPRKRHLYHAIVNDDLLARKIENARVRAQTFPMNGHGKTTAAPPVVDVNGSSLQAAARAPKRLADMEARLEDIEGQLRAVTTQLTTLTTQVNSLVEMWSE
jgi:predicted transcriptional regulator